MATIRVRGSSSTATSSPVRSVLVCLQQAGIPIQTKCGGRALCGRCVIQVHAGAQTLSPMRPKEIERLEAIQAPPPARLACQTYARGDIEIEIVNSGARSSEAP